jgi:hypothetical protein
MNREALPQTRQRQPLGSRFRGDPLAGPTVGVADWFPSLAMMAGAGIEMEP